MKFGLIPEFIGRLPVITTVSHSIATHLSGSPGAEERAIKQYAKMFEPDGVELEFSRCPRAIADRPSKRHRRAACARDHGGSPHAGDVRRPQRRRHRPGGRHAETVLGNVLPTIVRQNQLQPQACPAGAPPEPTFVVERPESASRLI